MTSRPHSVAFLYGEETPRPRDGILAAGAKAAAPKPGVALRRVGESRMDQAMKTGHDAGIMAVNILPIASILLREGHAQDCGPRRLATGLEKAFETAKLINRARQPDPQAPISRKIAVAPPPPRSATDLSDEEFAAVSGAPGVAPAYGSGLGRGEFIAEERDKMLAA